MNLLILTYILVAISPTVIKAVAIMAGLGLLFGILLTIAAKVFYVETDPRVEEVRAVLPGANCGACGQAGCDAFAEAVVQGKCPHSGCIPGGEEVSNKVADILGLSGGASAARRVAVVHCQGTTQACKDKYEYIGIDSCMAAAQMFNGPKGCFYGCLGKGDCVAACPFDAIHIQNGIAVVDREACKGCENCVAACPKQLIEMQDYKKRFVVKCMNPENGAKARKVCSAACIGCRKCVKVCPKTAISMNESVAHIDPSLCVNCGKCEQVCPTNAIVCLAPRERKIAKPKIAS